MGKNDWEAFKDKQSSSEQKYKCMHIDHNHLYLYGLCIYPLGLPRHFIVEPTAAITDLVIDGFDCPPILKDRVSFC